MHTCKPRHPHTLMHTHTHTQVGGGRAHAGSHMCVQVCKRAACVHACMFAY